jgi:hypothetical protein
LDEEPLVLVLKKNKRMVLFPFHMDLDQQFNCLVTLWLAPDSSFFSSFYFSKHSGSSSRFENKWNWGTQFQFWFWFQNQVSKIKSGSGPVLY